MRMPAEQAKSGGRPSATGTTTTFREPTNDDLIVSQQYLAANKDFLTNFRTDRFLPRLTSSSSPLKRPASNGQMPTVLEGWLVLVLSFLELLFELLPS